MGNIHQKFIEKLIESPIEAYSKLSHEFKSKNYLMAEFEELWPIVEQLFVEIQSDRIYDICKKDLGIALMRKLALQDLRHISIPGVIVMPYIETIRTIAKTLEFFDICTRYELAEGQNLDMSKFILEEENPKERAFAYYHRYRYLYYFHWLLDKIPDAILIPTTADFSAEDLMRFRCVPVFILGISTKLIYVDEFEQTPIEFFMHDMNHARRQFLANLEYCKKNNIVTLKEKTAFYKTSYEFSKKILDSLVHQEAETGEQRALKDLKKIIFFEIIHEDAEPFMPDVTSTSLQRKEGFVSTFEVPVLDPSTGLMNVSYTKETGIATLAYVRHKLQNGFFDKIGMINPQVVAKEYRTTRMIALAAYEILADIHAKPEEGVPVDDKGNVSFEYLLDRAVSFGPEVVHKSDIVDPDLEERNGGVHEVNIKTYFNKNKGEGEKMKDVVLQTNTHARELADVKVSVDIILYYKKDTGTFIYLQKRNLPPYMDKPCLPGGFLWSKETSLECAERILKQKVGISTDNLIFYFLADNPERDPRNHIISLVFKKELAEKDISTLDQNNFYNINSLPETGFDHKDIIGKVFSIKNEPRV